MSPDVTHLRPVDDDSDPTGVRDLLRSLPDPGPMPAALAGRIAAALRAEGATIPDPTTTLAPIAAANAPHDGARHIAHESRSSRRVLLAVAAALAVLGLGGAGVIGLLTHLGNGSASVAGSAISDQSSSALAPEKTTEAERDAVNSAGDSSTASGTYATDKDLDLVVYESNTSLSLPDVAAYLMTLATKPQDLPATPTPAKIAPDQIMNLRACAAAAAGPQAALVRADYVDYLNAPATVLLVSTAEGFEGYVVNRDCSAAATTVVTGPMRLASVTP